MNTLEFERQLEVIRKINEYDIKITKMAGYLSDYYIDRALETDDFSDISGFLIRYFSKTSDVGYLIAKYNEFGLNERVEDIDFNLNEWYKLKYEVKEKPIKQDNLLVDKGDLPYEEYVKHLDEEYIKQLIEKRKMKLMISDIYIKEGIRIRKVYIQNLKQILTQEANHIGKKKEIQHIQDEMEKIVYSDANDLRKTIDLNSRLIVIEREMKKVQDIIKPYYDNIEKLKSDRDKLYLAIIEKYPGITTQQIEEEIMSKVEE